jgi:hypothetical protein
MVAAGGSESSFANLVKVVPKLHRHLTGSELDRKTVISDLNYARDSLKHFNDGSDIDLNPREAAHDMIERAISNYWKVAGGETIAMERFRAHSRADV